MKMHSLLIPYAIIILILSGCLNNNENTLTDMYIGEMDIDIKLDIKGSELNNGTCLIPTLVNNNYELIPMRYLYINNQNCLPIYEKTNYGYVLNISQYVEPNMKITIEMHYNNTNNRKTYNSEDVKENRNTQFFLGTNGLSTWNLSQIWIYTLNLNGTFSLNFWRDGTDYILVDQTTGEANMNDGWNGYYLMRYFEDTID